MAERVLSSRELGRATLARQLLLEGSSSGALEAVARVAGLQAQVAGPPYVGLWTRLDGFGQGDLTGLLSARQVVRSTLMRSTLHLMSAEDFLRFRRPLQPALTRGLRGFFGKRMAGLDREGLVAAARERMLEGPLSSGRLRAFLSELDPGGDPAAMQYLVRTYLPMVQVPTGGRWGYGGTPGWALAERWLGEPVADSDDPRELVRRYLAAFGPATVRDVQAWSGMAGLKGAVAELRPELRVFRDEAGSELLDLPEMPLPGSDAPAPVRFLPEYDNLILAHADRSRVVADEHRSKVFLTAGRVRATILVDGMVSGTWKVERQKRAATLAVEPFARLAKRDRDALAAEGEALVRFVEDGAETFDVRFGY